MRRSIPCTVAVACLLLSIPRPAVSQQSVVSFDQLRTALKIGDEVAVSVNGSEVEARWRGLSPTSLVLLVPTGRLTTPSRRNFSENEVTQIRRRGDSLTLFPVYNDQRRGAFRF
jgi:CelD/BcsL family acetyltransferase involved in cellulose biosynthesis